MRKVFYVPPEVDDAGLTPLEFRLLGHLSRRGAAGNGRIEASIVEMAKACGLFRGTVKIGLRKLKRLNIVVEEPGNGKIPIRRLNPPSAWKLDRVLKTTPVGKQPGAENGIAPPLENAQRTQFKLGQSKRDKKLADCQREGILPHVL